MADINLKYIRGGTLPIDTCKVALNDCDTGQPADSEAVPTTITSNASWLSTARGPGYPIPITVIPNGAAAQMAAGLHAAVLTISLPDEFPCRALYLSVELAI